MERRYCSRCLQTFAAPGPDLCSREACRQPRPSRGWPDFLHYGDLIDARYRVEAILGAGGAGVTYRCQDEIDHETAAVKVLHGDRKRGTLANRLAIEGEVLELLDHDHIVPFRALKLHGEGPYYLATLHMPGGSMDAFVRRNGALSAAGTLAAGRQLAMALDYVHAGGIVHRDLKPANVLLEQAHPDQPLIRLADFGIARQFREPRPIMGLTRTGAFIGTPEYAAPEQVRGEKGIGPAADAFALGALLHYLASATPLHRREEISDWKAFKERTWDPAERPRVADLSDSDDSDELIELCRIDDLIDRLMHPDPALRLDMATAAMHMGANPAQLAPLDQPLFAPPSLATSVHDLDDSPALSVEALVPADHHDEDFEEADDDGPMPGLGRLAQAAEPMPGLGRLAQAAEPMPGLDALDSIVTQVTVETADEAEAVVSIAPAPAAGAPTWHRAEPAVSPPKALTVSPADERGSTMLDTAALREVQTPTRNASDEWQEDDFAWPTHQHRRNRRHGLLAVAAGLLLGISLAWPGGPAALIGEERLANLEGHWAQLAHRLEVARTRFAPHDATTPLEGIGDDGLVGGAPLRRPVSLQRQQAHPESGTSSEPAPRATERLNASVLPIRASDRLSGSVASSKPVIIEPRQRKPDAPSTQRQQPREVTAAPRSEPRTDTAVPNTTAASTEPTAARQRHEASKPARPDDSRSIEFVLETQAGATRIELGTRVPVPSHVRLPTLPSSDPQQPVDGGSAVDAWQLDRQDTRSLAQVIDDEADKLAGERLLEQIRREAFEADLRAARRAEEHEFFDTRRSRRYSGWEEAQAAARGANAADNAGSDDGGAMSGWAEADVEEGDVGALDALFGRQPRVPPQSEESCD